MSRPPQNVVRLARLPTAAPKSFPAPNQPWATRPVPPPWQIDPLAGIIRRWFGLPQAPPGAELIVECAPVPRKLSSDVRASVFRVNHVLRNSNRDPSRI